jgi:hypothetical protein
MKRTVHESRYFCGNKISEYGLENGYLDYRTLARAFDAVLVNDITKLFFCDINGEWNEMEQVNGYIDNSEEIEELQEELDELNAQMLQDALGTLDGLDVDATAARIDELTEQIDELEREQDEEPDIYQYYIVSGYGAELLQEYTNDPVYYLPVLDCYVWGVTHWGTSWDYVLTDVKLELE